MLKGIAIIMNVHTPNANYKIYYEDIAFLPFLRFYHKLYYSGHTELDTYVGIYLLHCHEMFNQHNQDIDLLLGYCWAIVYDAGPILNQPLILVSRLKNRYIE